MTYSIKVLGAETTLGSATNVDNATIVHIFNGHSAAVVIVRSDSSDAVKPLMCSHVANQF